jgi:hypothetical protein
MIDPYIFTDNSVNRVDHLSVKIFHLSLAV